MQVLYGVVGEGMGHATRSRVVLRQLAAWGHDVLVVASGRAFSFLRERFADEPRIRVEPIVGLHLVYENNELDKSASLWSNLAGAPVGVLRNIDAYTRLVGSFSPQVVISDFESWAWLYAKVHDLPVISIDNMQIINRCRHDAEFREGSFELTRLAVKARVPGAWHYLITSFFFPPVRKPRTTLLPPLLRPEILAARPPGAASRAGTGDHVLVYQTAGANPGILETLAALPGAFRVYGFAPDAEQTRGNVTLCPFSETRFVDDLVAARGVIAGGGYSLMGEAVHLGVPMLSLPIAGQYEQVLNAMYLEKLGYGLHASQLDAPTLDRFLDELPAFRTALAGWVPRDNTMLFSAIQELFSGIASGAEPPSYLLSPSLGSWEQAAP